MTLQGWRQRFLLWSAMLLATLFAVLFVSTEPFSAHAATTLPTKMNFQGRLTNSAGNTVVNGTYNMRFRIWNASSGGVQQWTEDRLVSATQGVTVTNGQFNVQLGSITSLPASIFTSNSLYFEIELPTPATATSSSPSWTEGAMTPRNQLATSAYAYNAETLDGIDGDAFAQLGTAGTFTAAQNINVSNANAFQVRNGSTNLFNVNTSNSIVTIGASDTTGAVLVLDVKTDSGDPGGGSATNGAMYYNSNTNKFRCYEGGAWKDCVTAAGGGTTLQNTYDNSSSPATITTTAAKGINIAAGAVPTTDLLTISNAGQAVTSAGVNGIGVTFVGGAAAVESSGIRVDLTPGAASGGTWSGMRIVANATGAASGVNENGITIDGPTSPGAGTEKGLEVGTGWDIGIDIQSGGMQLTADANEPATPAAGNLRIYAKDIAGRIMPKFKGPSGVDTPFQANLGFNRVVMVNPVGAGTNCGTSLSLFSTTVTGVGTCASPTLASTNLLTSTRRLTYSTGTTIGAMASLRIPTRVAWRGNAAGLGGFFYTSRFGTSTLVSGNRAFVGMSDVTTAPTNVDPLANTTPGKIGMATNSNTGNWRFVHNVSGTAPTTIDLGANFPVNNSALYELVMFAAQNGSSIGYRVTNLSTGNQTSGTASTNIPASDTFLSLNHWITNNLTASSAIMDFGGWYLESDY